jgi:hypothetical protein
MVEWGSIAVRIGLLVIGGLIALALKPFITLAILGLVILALAVIIFSLIPGGWIISYLGGRIATGILFTRFGLTLLLVILGFLGSLALGDWVLFLSGGLALMLLVKPPSILSRGRQKASQRTQEARIEKVNAGGGLFKKSILTVDNLESGVIVTGEEAVDVGRMLIREARNLGRKVVIIGESSYLIPEGSGRVKASRAEAFNVVEDFLKNPASIEAFTYSFVLANKLENDDIPLILVAAYNVVRDIHAGNISREDAVKAIPEQIQDRRGSIIKNVLSLCSFIGSKGISFTSLGNDWDILYISVRDLPQRQAVFAMAYSIYMLSRYDAVLVLHNPEKLLPDINILAYNARESWERAFNTIASWRDRGLGLILVSRSPIASPYLLRLCPTILATRMPEVPARLDDELMRQVVKAARGIKPGELVASTSDKLVIVKYKAPEPAYIPPPKPAEKLPEQKILVSVSKESVKEAVEEQKEEEIKPTALEREFGGKVVEAARILQQARSGLQVSVETAGQVDVELLKKLEEKGYLTQFGGLYYPSATGLELLNEYQKAVKERGPIAVAGGEPDRREAEPTPVREESRQMVIDHEEALDRLGEHVAGYYLAESLFRQGKYAQSVMKAYEFMVNSLKAFYSIEKGHLDDIVEMLEEKNAEKPLTVNEAKDAKTLLIEASTALKDGRQVSLTSAQRMLRYARKVLDHLSGGGGSEG